MHDSSTIADVGSMVNVSGSRMATPFGPPSPGSTPTKMPSTSPTIISASVFQVSRTAKPCSSRPKASIKHYPRLRMIRSENRRPFGIMRQLVAKRRFERPLRHDDVKRDIEGHEHD